MGGPDAQRNSRTTFKRRIKTLKDKAHQLSDICGARVYLLIDHEREKYVYNSSRHTSWPPPDETLEMHYPQLDRKTFNDIKGLHSPPHDPNRLKEYFAARFKLLCTLENLHKTVESAFSNTEDETPSNSQAER
ncbi:uncharacterized protein N7458_002581 [Penicillium daleae]|uniref:MADS-box domain-containing protein n=1 Tax=Penicillium daleae TaxID=63821 RepID=A0AAD6CDS8_9EURO|nr:uncharacterized protein N7458_002581 [Penicillium daleae]KAJ5461029.1 hypothetical protein N7458_002581 [Penicillium daleae]